MATNENEAASESRVGEIDEELGAGDTVGERSGAVGGGSPGVEPGVRAGGTATRDSDQAREQLVADALEQLGDEYSEGDIEVVETPDGLTARVKESASKRELRERAAEQAGEGVSPSDIVISPSGDGGFEAEIGEETQRDVLAEDLLSEVGSGFSRSDIEYQTGDDGALSAQISQSALDREQQESVSEQKDELAQEILSQAEGDYTRDDIAFSETDDGGITASIEESAQRDALAGKILSEAGGDYTRDDIAFSEGEDGGLTANIEESAQQRELREDVVEEASTPTIEEVTDALAAYNEGEISEEELDETLDPYEEAEGGDPFEFSGDDVTFSTTDEGGLSASVTEEARRRELAEDVATRAGEGFTADDVAFSEGEEGELQANIEESAQKRELTEDVLSDAPEGVTEDDISFEETDDGLQAGYTPPIAQKADRLEQEILDQGHGSQVTSSDINYARDHAGNLLAYANVRGSTRGDRVRAVLTEDGGVHVDYTNQEYESTDVPTDEQTATTPELQQVQNRPTTVPGTGSISQTTDPLQAQQNQPTAVPEAEQATIESLEQQTGLEVPAREITREGGQSVIDQGAIEAAQTRERTEQIEQQLEARMGRDLTPGEDFTTQTEEVLVSADNRPTQRVDQTSVRLSGDVLRQRAAEQTETQSGRRVLEASVAAVGGAQVGRAVGRSVDPETARQYSPRDFSSEDFAVREVDGQRQATLTDATRRDMAEQSVANQLESEYGREFTPGEDFTVSEGDDGGYQSELTESGQSVIEDVRQERDAESGFSGYLQPIIGPPGSAERAVGGEVSGAAQPVIGAPGAAERAVGGAVEGAAQPVIGAPGAAERAVGGAVEGTAQPVIGPKGQLEKDIGGAIGAGVTAAFEVGGDVLEYGSRVMVAADPMAREYVPEEAEAAREGQPTSAQDVFRAPEDEQSEETFIESATEQVGAGVVGMGREIATAPGTAKQAAITGRDALGYAVTHDPVTTTAAAGAVGAGVAVNQAEYMADNPFETVGMVGAGLVTGGIATRAIQRGAGGVRAARLRRRSDTETLQYEDLVSQAGVEGRVDRFETSPGAATSEAVREVRRRAAEVDRQVADEVGTEQVVYHTSEDGLDYVDRAEGVPEGHSELPGLWGAPDPAPLRLQQVRSDTGGYSGIGIPSLTRPSGKAAALPGDDIRGMPARAAESGYAVREGGEIIEQGLSRAEANRIVDERSGWRSSPAERVPGPDTEGYEYLTGEAEEGVSYVRATGDRGTELEVVTTPGSRYEQTGTVAVRSGGRDIPIPGTGASIPFGGRYVETRVYQRADADSDVDVDEVVERTQADGDTASAAVTAEDIGEELRTSSRGYTDPDNLAPVPPTATSTSTTGTPTVQTTPTTGETTSGTTSVAVDSPTVTADVTQDTATTSDRTTANDTDSSATSTDLSETTTAVYTDPSVAISGSTTTTSASESGTISGTSGTTTTTSASSIGTSATSGSAVSPSGTPSVSGTSGVSVSGSPSTSVGSPVSSAASPSASATSPTGSASSPMSPASAAYSGSWATSPASTFFTPKQEQGDDEDKEIEDKPNRTPPRKDEELGPGWFAEYLTVAALGTTAARGTPGEETLEERPAVEGYTSLRPVEGMVDATAEEEAAIEETYSALTFGAAGASDSDSGGEDYFDFGGSGGLTF